MGVFLPGRNWKWRACLMFPRGTATAVPFRPGRNPPLFNFSRGELITCFSSPGEKYAHVGFAPRGNPKISECSPTVRANLVEIRLCGVSAYFLDPSRGHPHMLHVPPLAGGDPHMLSPPPPRLTDRGCLPGGVYTNQAPMEKTQSGDLGK
jgi:hypothetical protein